MKDVSATTQVIELATASELEPVRKSVLVHASQASAFRVFAEQMDTWWPRTHHIGDSPMKEVVVEGRAGGRVYTSQENDTICQWGTVLTWEPPSRFVMAWQVSPEWKFEPDPARCSEVEVRFTPAAGGQTLVELEHRGLQKHGGACAKMRGQVDSEGGWGSLLRLFKEKVETIA
ncbi:hypothetical protein ACPOL_0418 [Acidisarcina polymorpha]|uniref:Activator of Hsp90 ATPase homologue 1/2-like C-terminal domain-containing protein n=1 Tax=Acidisarcina polymorpha TaxID=2211140 RepID=A0A2Z5FTM7_9BACT|nr:SRPBCC family protein [Acidisarcina polymorpha]AXC09795.1 hypothetical protein ACPOL_0418 [Acidisarcina polymorpha]